ncbi:SusE domain-containing protein [Sphingobacterium sp. lm-10]|uniref:SusE domain-containing protein n=1 Tax=Sphingobacterium sp. lm-10 TaxID=2944904 RepID=UPI0020214610|nr:SusF/SusE family outer membrane protein [Sphingobacterium sp. lm-10]MCL7989197.1 SusE domain-containing protein [Sphingobacterium sp. lm-10]
MKFIYHIALGLLGIFALSACEKEAQLVSVSSSEVPTLTISQDSLVLLQSNAADTAFTFNWSPVEVTWSNNSVSTNILRYAIQIDTKARGFRGRDPILILDTENTHAAMTVAQLNAALLEVKATPEEPVELVARLVVILAPNNIQYSNVVDLKATPYADVVMLPSLYIAGALNGWAHSMDYRLGSIEGDTKYEGYANFTAGNLAFKFSSQANWDGTNYGTGGAGKLSSAGNADNLEAPAAGYYLLKADTEALTWSATPMTWGIIGEAAGGWDDSNDVAMTYDATNRVWTATLNMTPGEFKFRANKAWAIGLGAGPRNGVLSYDGGNLRVTNAGRYLVTLDLSNAGYYTYTLEAQ